MARFAAAIPTWTPTAVADTANMTDAGHQTIQGGSTTQRGELREVYMGGQASVQRPDVHGPRAHVDGRRHADRGSLGGARSGDGRARGASGGVRHQHHEAAAVGDARHAAEPSVQCLRRHRALGERPGRDHLVSRQHGVARRAVAERFTGGTPGLLGSNIIFETL
jgi:hypothetical protein